MSSCIFSASLGKKNPENQFDFRDLKVLGFIRLLR